MMRLEVLIDGRIDELMAAELRTGERATSATIKAAAQSLKEDWRGQIRAAGMGSRLANTVRSAAYPSGQPSLNAAAMVYTKAPQIISAHEQGALVRSTSGFWLAIPTEAAGRGAGGRRVTPGEWQFRTGIRLRFVARSGKSALLVADGARINTRGLAKKKRGRRRRDGILSGETTVVIFTLVPQVKLPKRLNLYAAAASVHAGIPSAIVSAWQVPK